MEPALCAFLGRAVGDVFLTFCASDGIEHLLNYSFGSLAVLSVLTLIITLQFYDHLEPLKDD